MNLSLSISVHSFPFFDRGSFLKIMLKEFLCCWVLKHCNDSRLVISLTENLSLNKHTFLTCFLFFLSRVSFSFSTVLNVFLSHFFSFSTVLDDFFYFSGMFLEMSFSNCVIKAFVSPMLKPLPSPINKLMITCLV